VQMSSEKLNVLCFGDSLTEGLYSKWGRAMWPYTNEFSKLLGEKFAVYNGGVSGATTKQMLSQLEDWLNSKTNFKYVLILGGTNDLSTKPADKIAETLIQLITAALHHGATTFTLSVPEMRFGGSLFEEEKRTAINASLKEFADKTENCYYVDWAPRIPNNYHEYEHPMWSDNIHLSKEGYNEMGKVIYELCKDKIV